MGSHFESFLQESELDFLFRYLKPPPFESEAGQSALFKLFEAWDDVQGISNVLMHPRVIPEKLRFPYIQKGLEEGKHSYINLAAIVGLGNIPFPYFSESENQFLKTKLFHFCQHPLPVISSRASITLRAFCSKEDIPPLCHILPHKDPVTNHNLLFILFHHVSPQTYEEFLHFLREHFVPPSKLALPLDLIRKEMEGLAQGEKRRFFGPLYSYIPNYQDFQ